MSTTEAETWDERYARPDAGRSTSPSALLTTWLTRLPQGLALDLACGTGRHALALARAGHPVQGVDVSATGLGIAARRAAKQNLDIEWLHADLDTWPLPASRYAVIVSCQYLNRALMADYAGALVPGGMLLIEQHLQTRRQVSGPASARFRLAPGELPSLLAGLRLLFLEEARHPDPDGGLPAALVRAVAVRPPYDF